MVARKCQRTRRLVEHPVLYGANTATRFGDVDALEAASHGNLATVNILIKNMVMISAMDTTKRYYFIKRNL